MKFANTKPQKTDLSKPPRCCGRRINLNILKPFVDEKFYKTFKRGIALNSDYNRLFCPIPFCSTLVPSRKFHRKRPLMMYNEPGIPQHVYERSRIVRCPRKKCSEIICTLCHASFHGFTKCQVPTVPDDNTQDESSPAPQSNVEERKELEDTLMEDAPEVEEIEEEDEEDDDDEDMDFDTHSYSSEEDFALRTVQCLRCRTFITREGGCNHITCICGAEFCYRCGARQDNDDDHYDYCQDSWQADLPRTEVGARLVVNSKGADAYGEIPREFKGYHFDHPLCAMWEDKMRLARLEEIRERNRREQRSSENSKEKRGSNSDLVVGKILPLGSSIFS